MSRADQMDGLGRPKRGGDGSLRAWILGILLLMGLLIFVYYQTGHSIPYLSQKPISQSVSLNQEEISPSLISEIGNIPVVGSWLENITYSTGAFSDTSRSLKVIHSDLQQSSSTSWIEGTIKNQGNETYRGVAIFYDLNDEHGRKMASTYVLVGSLSPGQEENFHTIPVNCTASGYLLLYIIGG